MISNAAPFRVLSLCAVATGNAPDGRLRVALDAVRDWERLLVDAERQGLEPLLLEQIHRLASPLPPGVEARLKARCVQHAHASAVRSRVMSEALEALDRAGIPSLVLKGAALAQLVYRSPLLRPMRDVDLLVPAGDALRAWGCLRQQGFAPTGPPLPPAHRHLQGLAVTVDSATITIELHTALLPSMALVPRICYDDLAPRAQTFVWGGRSAQTLGREDMLWHVYLHAFVIESVLRPAIRLICVADMVTAVNAWQDALDWDGLRARYPRLVRALRRVIDIDIDGSCEIHSEGHWYEILFRQVWWPPPSWFDVRYGIDGGADWAWHRFGLHPALVLLAAAVTARRRVAARYFRSNA